MYIFNTYIIYVSNRVCIGRGSLTGKGLLHALDSPETPVWRAVPGCCKHLHAGSASFLCFRQENRRSKRTNEMADYPVTSPQVSHTWCQLQHTHG